MTVAEVRCAWDASMACSTSSALSAATKTKARLGAEPNIINACLTALRARAVISAGPGPCAIASPSPTSPTAVFSPIDGRHRRLGTHPSPNRGVGGPSGPTIRVFGDFGAGWMLGLAAQVAGDWMTHDQ